MNDVASDTINTYNLNQVITEPTRYDTNAQPLLDIMITDSPGLLSHVSVTPPIANLYHCVIACSLAFDFINNQNYSLVKCGILKRVIMKD